MTIPVNTNSSSGPDLLSGDANTGQNEPETNYVSMEIAQVPPVPDNSSEEEENQSIAESIVSSVMTADGIHDPEGFLCVCTVILVGDMSRGVFFPSMWLLVEALGGNQVTLGFSVAAFSFGRILVNPLFGAWSHQIGYSKTLVISTSILLFGTLAYAQVQNVGKPEFLIVAQTLLGIGSGTLGVVRAFVADVTAQRNRTTYLAWITAVQYAGFTVTPFFGALFNWCLRTYEVQWGILRLNKFTAPAYFMSIVVVSTLIVLCTFFRDRQRINIKKDGQKKTARRAAMEDFATSKTRLGITVYDCCILGIMLLNVATKGCIGSFETLGIAIAKEHFDMLSSSAGLTVAICGVLGVICLLNMGRLEKRFTDIQIISGSMIIMAAGIASLNNISRDAYTPSWRYMLAMFMIYSIGYPIGHTAVIGLFSKSKST